MTAFAGGGQLLSRFVRAFTTAEVLTTLAILGVVAAVSVPSLAKMQKKRYTVERLKVAYSLLTELTETSRNENRGKTPPYADNNRERAWNTYVKPYLEIAHDCGNGRADRSCFAGPNGDWYKPDGRQFDYNNNGYGTDMFHKVILKNGMSLAFAGCSSCMGLHNIFVVDIDGPNKGYSKMGQDVFVFEWARPNGDKGGWNGCVWNSQYSTPVLVPYVPACKNWQDGGYYTNTSPVDICNGTSGDWWNMWAGRGTTCAAWIMQNDWKIPNDYPWDMVNQKPAGFVRR